jgi:hypothetical protein
LPVEPLRAPSVPSALLGRRLGRVGTGAVLVLSPAIVAMQCAAISATTVRSETAWGTVPLIAIVWIAALGTGALAARFGRSPAALELFDARSFSVASFVVPAVGVALAGPLTLHALFGAPFWLAGVVTGDPSQIHFFDAWVALSLVGTIHVHIAFAVAMAIAAAKLAVSAPAEVALWPSVLVSVVPGLLLIFPPFVVWVTGVIVSQAFLRAAARWRAGDAEVG